MSRTNYASKYKSQAEETEIIEIESVTEPTEETIETVEDKPKSTTGIVISCKKLNVRVEPRIDSDVVCTIAFGSEVIIDLTKSTSEWYSVCTEAGIEGFCMSDYIIADVE